MTGGRAKARCIATTTGDNPPTDDISLKIDQDVVHVGGEITGTINYHGPLDVQVVLEGVEWTVVALSGNGNTKDGKMGVEYLKKHTSQRRALLREERVHSPGESTGFRFGLPEDLPGTLRCVLDGTDPTLPSQCQVKYTVTATIANDEHNKAEICSPIVVLPKKEAGIPIDPSIGVSIGSFVEALHQTLFECGTDFFCCTRESPEDNESVTIASSKLPLQDQDPIGMMKDNCIFLETSKNQLHLTPGQKLSVDVQDVFHLLYNRRPNSVWMIQLTEELQWRAQGRKAHNQQTWHLYANHHELPATLTPSYDDHDTQSLFHVRHEIIIYMTTASTKDSSAKEYLASTAPIPVKIVSSRAGWDA
jgi:hypothetical protein